MADPNTPTNASATSLQNNPALLAQLLSLLAQQNSPNGASSSTTPSQSPPSASSLSPEATDKSSALTNNQSVGGQTYGNANGSDGQTGFVNQFPNPTNNMVGNAADNTQFAQVGAGSDLNARSDLSNEQTQASNSQFNQLLQGLLKKYQSTPPTAPTPAPAAQTAPPPPPTVPDNQAAYTPPSQAKIPGMSPPPSQSTLPAMTSNSADIQAKAATGQVTPATVPPTMSPSLSEKLGQGTIQPSDITSAGGPLQASTASGISPGSLPAAQPQTAVRSYLNGVPGNATPPTPSQSPTDWNPLASSTGGGKTVDLGSADAAQPMFSGGANSAQGGLDATTGANAAPLAPGGANYAAGGLDSAGNYDASGGAASVGGGPSGMQMGSAIGSGISKIGSAIAGAYAPIQLKNLPTLQQTQQAQPRPLVFTSPAMNQ
jgi:hypothetical protein